MRFQPLSWLFLLILLSMLFNSETHWVVVLVHGQCLNDQKALLLQLNQSLVTFLPAISLLSATSKLSSWNSNTDCCSFWNGVKCDQAGHVISLDLSGEFISGGLDNSSSLFNLKYLERLNLAFNSISSTSIPSGLVRLSNLTYLNMSNSGFTGQIPIEISSLRRLTTLDLSNFPASSNPLMLSNPDFGTFVSNLKELRELRLDGVNISENGSKWCQALSSSLPKLKVLSLSNCYLSGPFDSSLLQLRSLNELRLDQNNMSAEVPGFFAEFSNLTSLRLSSCGLYGKFPERVFQIQSLQTLYLSNNMLLNGSLPEFPENGSLQTLVLSGTSFAGELPSSIGNLRFLSHLELTGCSFNGSIPASMKNLTQLLYLHLSNNNFTGSIESIGWSENLIDIDLSNNNLIGPFPSHWDKLAKLTNLNLKNNSLNGTIPPDLFTLPSMKKLDLSLNRFGGQLAEFGNGSSSQLDTLDLSINKLEGPIPMSIFEFSKLKILILSSNQFNGTIWVDKFFEKLSSLSSLDLSNNKLRTNSGGLDTASFPQVGTLKLRSCNLSEFPLFLQNQSTMNLLDLSDNQIRGKIPNWVWRIGNGSLSQLNLSHNFLEDPDLPLPDNSLKRLAVLDLHYNKLQGKNLILPSSPIVLDYSDNKVISSIPVNIDSYLSFAIFLSFSKNKIIGQIPISICKAGYLEVLDLSINSLSGPIPQCLGTIGSLRVLNLGGNNFSGTIPQMLPGLGSCNLRTLTLNRNKLEGEVPKSLANCSMLEVLDLGNNQINGNFPSWLGNMTQLRVLVLRSNKFDGLLGQPGTNKNFPKLQIIDISSNKFTGILSNDCFSSLTGMMNNEEEEHSNHKHQILKFGFLELTNLYYQDTVTITNKGLDMELVKILTVFSCIDLSNNEFGGVIPESIGSLKSLYVLNFSHNAFTGKIPSTTGNLSELESLDLSRNHLTGEIPVQLANLSFLSVLNLSYNELVGRIPTGPQLRTFDEYSYVGNNGLCGTPLPNDCSNTPQSAHTSSNFKEEVDWQFIWNGVGFGGGLGMVIAVLLFWKKGRQWFDKHTNRFLVMILPAGMIHISCEDRRVDAEETTEELTEMTGDYDYDDMGEEDQEGYYCVFCTKLDITTRRVIHNPNCDCHN